MALAAVTLAAKIVASAKTAHPNENQKGIGMDSPKTSTKKRFDAIIIGGGHNGLVTAAYLAKSGKSVCVLERRHVLGGCSVTEELWPGYHVSTCLLYTSPSPRDGLLSRMPSSA